MLPLLDRGEGNGDPSAAMSATLVPDPGGDGALGTPGRKVGLVYRLRPDWRALCKKTRRFTPSSPKNPHTRRLTTAKWTFWSLIDKLDDVVHNARPVPLTDQVRVDREEIYDLLDQMRATIPEEIKQARWIVKERQEMLAEAKREAERIVREAREQQARLISDEEVTKQAERAADEIVEGRPHPRARNPPRRRGLRREILNTLEVNLQKFLAARPAWPRTASPGARTNRRPSSTRLRSGAPPIGAFVRLLELEVVQRRPAGGRRASRARGHPGRRRLSDSPQTAQRPRQSGRQRRVVGIASRVASWPSGRCRARRRPRRGSAAPARRSRPGRPHRESTLEVERRRLEAAQCTAPRGGPRRRGGRRSRCSGARPPAAPAASAARRP